MNRERPVPESVEEDEAATDPTSQPVEWFFALAKPDAVELGLVGEIIHRFEKRGLSLCYLKWFFFTDQTVSEFYLDKQDYSFWEPLKAFLMSGPLVAMVWRGADANVRGRQVVGRKDPAISDAGTIRGGLASKNRIECLVHGSRTEEEAIAEIEIVCPEFAPFPSPPSTAAERPSVSAPFAPGNLAYKPEQDGWEGSGLVREQTLALPTWPAPEEYASRW